MQLWAIQTKLLQEDSTRHLVEAFQKFGLNWAAFPFPPMVGQIPDFHWDGPVVYYGSTALVRQLCYSSQVFENKVVFFDGHRHSPLIYGQAYGESWLNHGSRIVAIRHLLDERHEDHEEMFIRPVSGLKTFAGRVFRFAEFKRFVEIGEGMNSFGRQSDVVVGAVKNIHREYRTWIVDGEVAAIAGYKRNGKMESWLPSEGEAGPIVEFAKEQAAVYAPSPVFVLDVACLTGPSGLRVVEVNCFNSAGFYCSEVIHDVVYAVSNYVASHPT